MTDFYLWGRDKNKFKVLSEDLPIGKSVFSPFFNSVQSIMIPCTIASAKTLTNSYAVQFDKEILEKARRQYRIQIGTHCCDGMTPDGNGFYLDAGQIYVLKVYDDGLDNWE